MNILSLQFKAFKTQLRLRIIPFWQRLFVSTTSSYWSLFWIRMKWIGIMSSQTHCPIVISIWGKDVFFVVFRLGCKQPNSVCVYACACVSGSSTQVMKEKLKNNELNSREENCYDTKQLRKRVCDWPCMWQVVTYEIAFFTFKTVLHNKHKTSIGKWEELVSALSCFLYEWNICWKTNNHEHQQRSRWFSAGSPSVEVHTVQIYVRFL